MQYDLCRHIKTSGVQCQSPALLHNPYCFFHTRLNQRHSAYRHTPATRGYLIPGKNIQLAPLEDRESIQVALSVVINALATGQLEPRRATALLYGLQLASNNAVRLQLEPMPSDIVRTAQQTEDGLELASPGATADFDLLEEDEEPGDEEKEEEDESEDEDEDDEEEETDEDEDEED